MARLPRIINPIPAFSVHFPFEENPINDAPSNQLRNVTPAKAGKFIQSIFN
jgi:hypothetical protein